MVCFFILQAIIFSNSIESSWTNIPLEKQGKNLTAAVATEKREELTAAGMLHDEVDLGVGVHDLVKLEDFRVVGEAAHSRNLAAK